MTDPNAPAFPVWELNGHGKPEMTAFGLTKREWMAGLAMQGMFANASFASGINETAKERGIHPSQIVALACFEQADAMCGVPDPRPAMEKALLELEAVYDIWRDGRDNAPEHRAYTSGALEAEMEGLPAAIADLKAALGVQS